MPSIRTALLLNTLILAGYWLLMGIATSAWMSLGLIMLFAVTIRCLTMVWLVWWAASQDEGVANEDKKIVWAGIGIQFLMGLLFVTIWVTLIYWLGHYWPELAKVMLIAVGAFVMWQSLFPMVNWKSPTAS